MKFLVTGGAGFIGSHIVDRLVSQQNDVIVYDNLSTGQERYPRGHCDNKHFTLVKGDILDTELLTESCKGSDFLIHLAANADVRGGINNTAIDFEQNVVGTRNVLEAMRVNGIKRIAFSSSAVVYGEPEIFPTPESCQLIQTSLYGASKLACEAMIQAYCTYYDMKSWIFRFVSWIGERYSHGVIFDFVRKLQDNPNHLHILGNGEQRKSYLYITDGIQGVFSGISKFQDRVNIFNVGHTEIMTVNQVGGIVCNEMGLKDVNYSYSGGIRGWVGDSPFVQLDISKLQGVGWIPRVSIEEGIRMTVKYLLENRTR